MLTGRFIVIRLLESLPKKTLVTAGFVLIGISHLWFITNRTPEAAILAAIIIGIGYSLEYPSLSVWISAKFEPKERGKPVALFNMVFDSGIFITALVGGWVMEQFSPETYLVLLIALALGAAVGMGKVRT